MTATRRLAAIMFTDMVGYTEGVQVDEASTLRLRQEQEDLIRPVLLAHGGREVKSTGDGFLVEFESALKAAGCAVDIQRRLHERNGRAGVAPIRLRIGLHLGDVEPQGADIFGDAVNIAARIQPVAEPGGICVSGAVYEQVRNKIPDKLERLPSTGLKGLQTPIELYRIVLPWAAPETDLSSSGPAGLAVLPFSNISPDPKDEYFAEGLTEELISVLSRLRELRVISRTSVVQYRASTKPVTQIGRELGVSSILEGSVRKAGNRLRITAQLIDAQIDRHVWARTFDRELDDIFEVQAEIAREVAAALEVELKPGEQRRLESRPAVRSDSYLAYLRARTLMHENADRDALQEAKQQYQLAITLDPNNAAAYSGLAEATLMTGMFYADVPSAKWMEVGRSLVAKAIELDPNLSEAHATLGLAFKADFDYPAAEREFRLALALNPSDSEVHNSYALVLVDECRTEEALAEWRLGEEADPRWSWILGNMAELLVWLGRFDEALLRIRKLGEVSPDSARYHSRLGVYYLARSELPRFAEEWERVEELTPNPQLKRLHRAWRHALTGAPDLARAALQTDEDLAERPEHAEYIALIYFELGDMDRGFQWLTKAFATRNAFLGAWRLDPRLQSVRADPRFLTLLRSIGRA